MAKIGYHRHELVITDATDSVMVNDAEWPIGGRVAYVSRTVFGPETGKAKSKNDVIVVRMRHTNDPSFPDGTPFSVERPFHKGYFTGSRRDSILITSLCFPHEHVIFKGNRHTVWGVPAPAKGKFLSYGIKWTDHNAHPELESPSWCVGDTILATEVLEIVWSHVRQSDRMLAGQLLVLGILGNAGQNKVRTQAYCGL